MLIFCYNETSFTLYDQCINYSFFHPISSEQEMKVMQLHVEKQRIKVSLFAW